MLAQMCAAVGSFESVNVLGSFETGSLKQNINPSSLHSFHASLTENKKILFFKF